MGVWTFLMIFKLIKSLLVLFLLLLPAAQHSTARRGDIQSFTMLIASLTYTWIQWNDLYDAKLGANREQKCVLCRPSHLLILLSVRKVFAWSWRWRWCCCFCWYNNRGKLIRSSSEQKKCFLFIFILLKMVAKKTVMDKDTVTDGDCFQQNCLCVRVCVFGVQTFLS